jgi:hypothetical protein
MYFLDPDRGSRRRTHTRNQMVHVSNRMRDVARRQASALRHTHQEVDDSVLMERVRAMLAHAVPSASALALDVSRGVVTVSGPILRAEMRMAIKALKKVPGVRRVISALEPSAPPDRLTWPSEPTSGWARGRGAAPRVAAALASAAGIGLMARAAMQARARMDMEDTELRS